MRGLALAPPLLTGKGMRIPSTSKPVAAALPPPLPAVKAQRATPADVFQQAPRRGPLTFSSEMTILPSRPRASIGPGLFQTTLAPGTPNTKLLSENSVPMKSMVLNAGTINGDALLPRFIAQAAVKANPSIQFLVPTTARYQTLSESAFIAERQRIATQLGVPTENITPVRSDMAAWPQDEFLAGSVNGQMTLLKPLFREGAENMYEPGSKSADQHWTSTQRTLFGANDLANELGVQVGSAEMIARGGDTQILTRPDGQQVAIFSAETVGFAAGTRKYPEGTSETTRFLKGLDVVMRGLQKAGIPLENIAPIGKGDITYKEALAQMSDAERSTLAPDVRARFEALSDLPLPTEAYAYHTDVAMFSPDGKTMFVNETSLAEPAFKEQLERFGFAVRTLPSTTHEETTPKKKASDGFHGSRQTSYMNTVMGRLGDGRLAILMPTEALDPNALTPNDIRAKAALQSATPEAVIIPVGGRSAISGNGEFADGSYMHRDWGMHCMSNVLPLTVTPR
jgi:hypothetical protein